MGNNYVGVNFGGIVGGKKSTVNNFNSFNASHQDDLNSLLSEFQSAIEQADIPKEKKQEAKECIDIIKEEAPKEKPKKSIIKLAFGNLKEFATSEKFIKLIDKLTPIIIALINKKEEFS